MGGRREGGREEEKGNARFGFRAVETQPLSQLVEESLAQFLSASLV